MKTPHKCPVCGGSGIVPNGFYNQTLSQWSTTSMTPDVCQNFSGTGVMWNGEYYVPIPDFILEQLKKNK